MASSSEITQILQAYRQGDDDALHRLMPMVYDDLRRIARQLVRQMRPGETLNTTGLVHEAYLKLVDQTAVTWEDRGHFFAVASIAMRQIIIDYARRRCAGKRGGGQRRLTLDENLVATANDQAELLIAIDETLGRLESIDERMVRVVECRFFAGLSEQETAEALELSLRTTQRLWMKARAWLKQELG